MKYESHYGDDAIIDGVFYVTFAIVYTHVKVNVHPTHYEHSHTMFFRFTFIIFIHLFET
jgi:hypothetical protein